MTSLGIQESVPTHFQAGNLAANGEFSDANAYILALKAMSVKPFHTREVTKKKRADPKPSIVGRWLGDLIHGRLKFVQEKKLRVVETVSLGEKRFVTILQVEGRKLLIGGSSSNVALLASLDDAASPVGSFKSKLESMEFLQ